MTNVQCHEIPMKIRNFIIMALENFMGAECMKSQIFMGNVHKNHMKLIFNEYQVENRWDVQHIKVTSCKLYKKDCCLEYQSISLMLKSPQINTICV